MKYVVIAVHDRWAVLTPGHPVTWVWRTKAEDQSAEAFAAAVYAAMVRGAPVPNVIVPEQDDVWIAGADERASGTVRLCWSDGAPASAPMDAAFAERVLQTEHLRLIQMTAQPVTQVQ